MRNFISKLFILILVLLSLTSCALSFNNFYLVDDTDTGSQTIDQIVISINSKDSDTLKSLFAKNTCNEVGDMDDGISKLFEFIQGEIISYGKTAGERTSKKNDHGQITKYIKLRYYFETKDEKYYVAVWQCVVDTVDKGNVGICSFDIISEKDWHDDYVYGGHVKPESVGINIEKNIGDDSVESSNSSK